jgi:negative regulator of sigma-B (phosphoserine phosphatase)
MDSRRLNGLKFVSWAVASRPSPGEYSSGDLSVVEPVPHGVLIGVIDGLGHGVEAAKAAAEASATVRRCAGDPIESVLQSCHKALKGTRGAVITLLEMNRAEDTLTWSGVGNIEGRLWPAMPGATLIRQSPPLRGGVVGHAMPRVSTTVLPLSRGDLVILSTDGISNDFHEEFRLEGTVQQIADDILEEYWTAKDDALVLVARYLGDR